MDSNLFALIESRCRPGASFLETPAGARWTYGDLLSVTGRFANALRTAGVRPGDRVAAQVEKSPEAYCLYLAVLRVGAIYVPLNTAYTPAELEYFLGDAQPAALVCDPADAARRFALAEAAGVRARFTLDAAGGGTLPSIAAHEPAAFETVDAHGLFIAAHCALLSGASMLFASRFVAEEVVELLPRATVMMGVPTFYTRLLESPRLDRDLCRGVRLFVSGSAPLLPDTAAAFTARTRHEILERYGMTEAIVIASNPLRGERRPGSVGLPVEGVELRVADADDVPLPRGAVGGVQIRGTGVMKGYWRQPERTAQEFTRDGWFRTADLGVLAPDGYLSLVGRAKDLVISGGYNVYPKEVELAIDALPGVAESAVFGLPHDDFGEAVTAAVVRSDPAVDDAAILAALRERLAAYKLPKRVHFVDALPRNAMGKVLKTALRERFTGR